MDMPLEYMAACPCCESDDLEPVAGIYCQQVVVVSACRGCGWLGYVTRPRAEWFESFYATEWDEERQFSYEDFSKLNAHPSVEFVVALTEHGAVKRGATVCDVGCGTGIAAWQLRKLGYDAYGVEKCNHRAIEARTHDVPVANDLSAYHKFDVITTNHVLEHSNDPGRFIREIAEHQDEGGILYIGVPNQVGEPSMGCLLFLPHLHSFTLGSLCWLAERYGYSLSAVSKDCFNIQAAFVKNKVGTFREASRNNPIAKLNRAIHANGQGDLLSWCGNYSDAWWTSADRFAEWSQARWKPRAVRAVRIAGPGRFPVELQCSGLFVK